MRFVRRTSLAPLAALLVALGAFGTASAAAGTTYSARIFVSEKFPALHGAIHSHSAFCEAQRPVLVYRVRPGRDKLVGHRRSHGNGTWKVPLGKKLGPGSYLVEAPLFGSAALGIKCLPVKSKIVPVE
jgi:hypothetical protein